MSDTKKALDVFNGRLNKTIHKTHNLKLKTDIGEKKTGKKKDFRNSNIYVIDAAQGGWDRKKYQGDGCKFCKYMNCKFADPKQSMNAKQKTHKENDHHTTVHNYSHIIIKLPKILRARKKSTLRKEQ